MWTMFPKSILGEAVDEKGEGTFNSWAESHWIDFPFITSEKCLSSISPLIKLPT